MKLEEILENLIENYNNMKEGREKWLVEFAADCISMAINETDHSGGPRELLYKVVDDFIQSHELFKLPTRSIDKN